MADSFVVAAGKDAFLSNGRRFLELRGAKRPPKAAKVTNIEKYLKHLAGLPAAKKPVAKIQIVCHASVDGYLGFDLDTEAPKTPQFRDTTVSELVIAQASGSVVADPSIVGPDTEFRIRGCEIGNNPKFLQVLKDTMGGSIPVTAPKHFDSFVPLENKSRLAGVFEWMNYVFMIRRPTRFADRAAALADYQAQTANFTFIDGVTTVPPADWDAWLPLDTAAIWGYKGFDLVVTERPLGGAPLGQTVVGLSTLPVAALFTFWERRVVNKLPDLKASDVATPANPRFADEAEMRAFAKVKLPDQPRFTAAFPLPLYESFGFATLDLMIDGLSWKVEETNAKTGARRLVGTQFEYAVGPAILDAAGNVFFNFEKGPNAPAGTVSITNILETDARFFGTV